MEVIVVYLRTKIVIQHNDVVDILQYNSTESPQAIFDAWSKTHKGSYWYQVMPVHKVDLEANHHTTYDGG